MLDNYEKLRSGVIKNLAPDPPIYDEEYVIRYNNSLGGQANELSCLRLGLLLGCLNHPIQKLLDVGYGDGNFLERASTVIPKCFGYDVSPAFPLPPSSNIKSVKKITGTYYDVVTFYNSLEHMSDIDFIKEIQCTYLAITTPWCHYFSDNWFQNWKRRKPKEHIWHFNDETLTRFMLRQGYTVLHYSNVEDTLRGEKIGYASYLTAIFKKG